MKEVTKEVYLKWYEDMLLWRKFEDKPGIYTYKVRGFHFSTMAKRQSCGSIARNGFEKIK
jgi:TPP-dependent pyruvate/acetoin dehydrogenase alpha subunit